MTTTERQPDLTYFFALSPKYGFKIDKLNEGPNYSYVSVTNIYADFQMTQVIGKQSRTGFVNTLGGNSINSFSALVELPEGTFGYYFAFNNAKLDDDSPRNTSGGNFFINVNGLTGAFTFSDGYFYGFHSPIEEIRICYVYFNK